MLTQLRTFLGGMQAGVEHFQVLETPVLHDATHTGLLGLEVSVNACQMHSTTEQLSAILVISYGLELTSKHWQVLVPLSGLDLCI
jgi:hypothetical protein